MKRVLVAVIALLILVAGIGLLLPGHVTVKRSVTTNAQQEAVFALVNGFGRYQEWSPWAARDPSAIYTYEGPASGVGARMTWKSDDPEVGSGSQVIVASEPYRFVKSRLDLGRGEAFASFTIEAEGESVRVTWTFDSDVGMSPIARYFGLAMNSMIGPDYEKGLASLAQLALESPPNLALEEVAARRIAFASGETEPTPEKIATAVGQAWDRVAAFLEEKGLKAEGPPIAITTAWEKDRYAFAAAIPIGNVDIAAADGVEIGQTYSGKVIRAVHKGPCEDIGRVYEQISAYMREHDLSEGGNSWEQYVNDPNDTPPEEQITHVYFPVR